MSTQVHTFKRSCQVQRLAVPIADAMSAAIYSHMDVRLEPINWSLTYGPQELDNWNDRISIYQQLSASAYYTDADDYMEYTSMEVI